MNAIESDDVDVVNKNLGDKTAEKTSDDQRACEAREAGRRDTTKQSRGNNSNTSVQRGLLWFYPSTVLTIFTRKTLAARIDGLHEVHHPLGVVMEGPEVFPVSLEFTLSVALLEP